MAKQPEKDITTESEIITDLTTAQALSALLAELGLADSEKVKIQARLITPDNPGGSRVYDGPPHAFDLMNVAREFGSGKYQITLRGPSEAAGGRVAILANEYESVRLTHAEEQAIAARTHTAPVAAPVAPVQAQPSLTEIAAVVAQAVVAAMPRQADAMEQFKGMAEVFKAMQPAPVAAPAIPAPITPADPLDGLMQQMGTMTKFKMVRSMMEDMGMTVGDNGQLEEFDLLKTGVEAFQTIAGASKRAQRQQAPVDTGDTIEGTATAVTEGDDMNMVSVALMALESAAKKNKPAADIARQVAALSGSEVEIKTNAGPVTHTMEAVLRSSQWWEVLVHFRPTLTPYKAWAELVRAETIRLWDAEDASTAHADNPPKGTGKRKKD